MAASVQYTHATSDRDLADRLWGERAAHAYPYASLLAAGARLAGGSDAPVEELDPLAGLRAAVLRTDGDRPPWRPEQAIGLDAALASFTTEPAWLAGEEDVRGRIAPGLLADLVVLDRDPSRGWRRPRGRHHARRGMDAHTSRKRMMRPPMLDLVAVAQARLAHAPAVDEDAVAAAVVGDDGLAVALEDERMPAGDGGVVEHDVRTRAAADPREPAEAEDDDPVAVRNGEVAAGRERPDGGRGEPDAMKQRPRPQDEGRGPSAGARPGDSRARAVMARAASRTNASGA